MKYEVAEALSEQQIIERFHQAHNDDEIIRTLLSAVLYTETDFAGRLLLSAFERIDFSSRRYLANVVTSFMQMHRTDFLADEFLAELRKSGSDVEAMIGSIAEIEEFRSMFAGRSSHLRDQ